MSRFGSKYKSQSIFDRSQSSIIDTPINITTTIGSVVEVISDNNKSVGNILVTIKKEDGTFKNEVAYPMSPHFISLPLPNERVSLIQDSITNDWYYLTPLSKRGFVNHMSNPIKRVFKRDTSELYTGKTFTPNPTLRTLNLFEGDTILQGRNGQSLRFGSKREDNNTPWGVDGEEGQPIITLRTGVTQIENLNIDFSSLYLTSGQTLPIELSSELPKGVTRADLYDESQVIMTAGRLLLYSKDENILLSSKRDIGLSTSKWAVDVSTLLDQISLLCDNIITIAQKLSDQGLYSATSTMISSAPGTPTSPSSNAPQFNIVFNEAASVRSQVQQIKNNIDNMKQE